MTASSITTNQREIFRPVGSKQQPEHYAYGLSGLLGFPSRLFRPIRIPSDAERAPDADIRKSEKPVDTQLKVGKPRTFAKTPANQIALKDVLENRHLPPLSRDEFTGYLAYEERSAENWYFMSWIEGYTKQYQEWLATEHLSAPAAAFKKAGTEAVTSDAYTDYINQHAARNGQPMIDNRNGQSPATQDGQGQGEGATIASAPMEPRPSITPAHLPLHLSQTFNKALFAFFHADSPFQLNLNAEVVARITMDSQHSPDPSVFRPAKEAVEAMLTASLQKYLIEVSGNAGRYRSLFAVLLGCFVVLAGFIPLILALWYHWSRALRLVCLPIFFFGTLTAIGGLRRTCIVIFMFGTARQLRMFELEKSTTPRSAAPRLPRRQKSQVGTLGTVGSATFYVPSLSPYVGAHNDKPDEASAKSPKLESLSADDSSIEIQMDGHKLRKPATFVETEGYVNPWEAMELERTATASSRTLTVRSAPVFGSLTRVLAPEIIRKQRAAIIRGMQYGVVVACILGGIAMGVPNIAH